MREILFRGKEIFSGEWVTGFLVDAKHIGCFVESDIVNPETVGQFTGLIDKNGKKIFEGDICKHRSNYSGNYIISVVIFTDGCFLAMADNNSGFALSEKLEIIGNIHDNPELIGGKENE